MIEMSKSGTYCRKSSSLTVKLFSNYYVSQKYKNEENFRRPREITQHSRNTTTEHKFSECSENKIHGPCTSYKH